jgi:tRNA(His) guanylyltransferase
MNLVERMKKYEYINRNYLMSRTPIIIRLDGKAFHSFTKGMNKPFDNILILTMQQTMLKLCEEIQGAIFGYTQSDEISICIYNNNINSDSWFDGNIQKIISISSSIITLYFNKYFKENDIDKKYTKKYDTALFDSRTFSIPLNEVENYLIWRQQDCVKNSIQMLAQSICSHKELQNLNGKQIQDKLFTEKGINWNDLSIVCKRGSFCKKVDKEITTPNGIVNRKKWIIDLEMPIIVYGEEYINNLLNNKED